MAKLGDAFSDDERRKSVLRQLQPGTVVYLDIAFAEGRRSKYVVVACVNRECCTFIVNSRVHPFIEAHPFAFGLPSAHRRGETRAFETWSPR